MFSDWPVQGLYKHTSLSQLQRGWFVATRLTFKDILNRFLLSHSHSHHDGSWPWQSALHIERKLCKARLERNQHLETPGSVAAVWNKKQGNLLAKKDWTHRIQRFSEKIRHFHHIRGDHSYLSYVSPDWLSALEHGYMNVPAAAVMWK